MSDTILGINFLQILLHAFNLIILVGGLYLLLYSPVKKFMKQREDSYIKQDEEAQQRLESAKKTQADYEAKVADVEKEINEKRAAAAKSTQERVNAQLDLAKEQAEKIVENAKKEAEEEKAKILEDAQKEITLLAIATTEKLLSNNQTETVNQFISATEGSEDV